MSARMRGSSLVQHAAQALVHESGPGSPGAALHQVLGTMRATHLAKPLSVPGRPPIEPQHVLRQAMLLPAGRLLTQVPH